MTDPRLGFVLAGGGTKGAFEVGVLRHLVQGMGLRPGVVCGTSAGSILAAKLAQARSDEEFVEAVDVLTRDLLAMTEQSTVFAKQPWLDDFTGTAVGEALDRFLQMRPPPPSGVADLPAARSQHRRRRWHAIRQAVEELPAVHHAHQDFPGHRSSLLSLAPLEAALRGRARGIAPLDVDAVARTGLELRLTVTALEAGVPRYVTGRGEVLERDGRTPAVDAEGPVDVVEAVVASSSVPMVFAPRRIGRATYVDGGVCENVPVGAAVAAGARRLIAVLAVPLDVAPDDTDWTTASFARVYWRSVDEVGFSAKQHDNLAVGLPEDAELTVVAPTVDVVGAFEVNPGLLRIDLDYGALRAVDVFETEGAGVRRRASELTDRIIVERERAWYLEEELWQAPVPGDLLRGVRAAKRAVREALSDRAALGLPVPDGADAWWSTYESHSSRRPDVLPADPWDGAFDGV